MPSCSCSFFFFPFFFLFFLSFSPQHALEDQAGKSSSKVEDDSGEEALEFAGAVGFFDSPEPTTVMKQRALSIDHGAMGFFACLDEKGQKTLGLAQKAFTHNGKDNGILEWTDLSETLLGNPDLIKIAIKNNGFKSADLQVMFLFSLFLV